MKCHNCGDLGANEINISVNVSECNPSEEKEYSGWTDFAPDCTSNQLGVYCNACDTESYEPGWQAEVIRYLATQGLHWA